MRRLRLPNRLWSGCSACSLSRDRLRWLFFLERRPMDGLSLMRCHGKEESERASEQGGGGDDDLVAVSRVPLQGHTREASERASPRARGICILVARHHLRAWAAFLREDVLRSPLSLQSPPSLPGLSVIRRPRKFSMTVEFL